MRTPLSLSKTQDDLIFRRILRYKGPLTKIAKAQFLASNPSAQATYDATRAKILSRRDARNLLNPPLRGSVGLYTGDLGQKETNKSDKAEDSVVKDLEDTPPPIDNPPPAVENKIDPTDRSTFTDPGPVDDPAVENKIDPATPPDTSKDINAENIQALGQKYLGRGFSQDALDYYSDPDKKLSLDQIEKMVSDSPEAKQYAKRQRGVPDTITPTDISTSTISPTEDQKVKFTEIKDEDVTKVTDPRDITTVTTDTIPSKAAETFDATKTQTGVEAGLKDLMPTAGTVSENAQVLAQTVDATTSAVNNLKASEINNAQTVLGTTRTLQAGELIDGASVKTALVEQSLNKFTAAQQELDPMMTLQGQLENLTKDFDAKNPPAWAAGSMRAATAVLNQRGLGASSLAGQAVIQAVMESAVPIAQADAQVVFNLGIQNLSNRQQRAVLAAQQRATFLGQEFDQEFQAKVTNAAKISDIANQNFTADIQIAIENSKLAQSVDLANLNNKQALVMAEAAQIANLETTNLNNRQQAAVQNAQAFLQMDLTNLNYEQQTSIFKAQEQIKSLLTDAAAENAAKQFNASSQNQVNQFYDSLSAEIKRFNAQQQNAMEQFNVQQGIAVEQFNAQQQNAVDQFNASNGLVVSQANAQWRQQIATINTAAQNQINQFNAQNALALTVREYEGLWQEYRDKMQFAFNSGESVLDRENELAKQAMVAEATIDAAKYGMAGDMGGAIGDVLGSYYNANPRNQTKNVNTTGGGGGGGTQIISIPTQTTTYKPPTGGTIDVIDTDIGKTTVFN